jgi:hypothetical protein
MNEEISWIVDLIEDYGKRFITHPNNNVKIFAASRLIDQEVARRMEVINKTNKETGFIVVGGVK